jgi:small neutral amino acid transporter SnatA (MarC family)
MTMSSTMISSAIVLVIAFFGEALRNKLGISIEALHVSRGLMLFQYVHQRGNWQALGERP